MNFHDDSHILSRLGILDSLEESPRRFTNSPSTTLKKEATEKGSFVDITIGLEADSDVDQDEATLDQDTLLVRESGSKAKVLRRQPESFQCRYFLLMISYFSLGVMCQSSSSLFHGKMVSSNINCIWQPLGIVFGILTGRAVVFQVNSAFIFLAIYFFSTLIVSAIRVADIRLFASFLGFLIGVLSYAGLTIYYSLWRGHNRKLMWFFTLFALGSAVTLLNNQPVTNPETLKRDTTLSFVSERNGGTKIHLKRPDTTPKSTISTTKQTEKQNAAISNIPATSSNDFPVERSLRNKNRYSLSVPLFSKYVPNTSTKIFILVVFLIALCFHVAELLCCCTKYQLRADVRVLKLRELMQHLTTACRVHLFIFYTIFGIAEGLLVTYLSSVADDHRMTFHCISFIVRFIAIFPGPATYSVLAVVLIAATGLFSSLSFALSVAVNVNIIILCASCGLLPLCVFLNIESRLAPFPITFSDYFLFSYSIGQCIATLFCWEIDFLWLPGCIAVVVGLLNVSLYFLLRVVMKSVRLKDIMEYTTQHGTLEEYLTLVERDHFSGSDIDCHNSNDEL